MVNAKEERKYKELKKLGRELHVPIPEAFWTLEVFDKDGKLIQKHKQRSHSWVRNAYNLMMCQLASLDGDDAAFGAGNLNIKDTGGTVQHASAMVHTGRALSSNTVEGTDQYTRGYRGAAGEDDVGIVVGSGTDAESFEDYALQTPIANGSGAGQLSYVEQEPMSEAYADTTKSNEMVRYINNNSGGDVSINEVGLIVQGVCGGGEYKKWLHSRDKLASTVTVPNTGQLKVTYTIQLAYPA